MILGFPVADPQFWIVTAITAAGIGFAAWRLVRSTRRRRRGAVRPVPTGLTVGGQPVRRR